MSASRPKDVVKVNTIEVPNLGTIPVLKGDFSLLPMSVKTFISRYITRGPQVFLGTVINNWQCKPEKTLIAHYPHQRLICSYGSGYGGKFYSWQGMFCIADGKYDGSGRGLVSRTHAGKSIMHDPMAMRPFMGYKFGNYLQHWLNLNKAPHKMPKIFHVNWFRVNEQGQFLWPGFGENIRVLDWIVRRCAGDEIIAVRSPIGFLPNEGTLNIAGLDVNWHGFVCVPEDYWVEDARESRQFLENQVGQDVPQEI